jgi:SLOG cluster3 family
MGAVFLSASVPVEGRQGFETASPYLIREAVSALVEVVLGRRLLVWGGHPAITPMIWAAAQDLGVDYASDVRLYQSRYFEDRFPEDNRRFNNVVYTPGVLGDQPASFRVMREQMLQSHSFEAAVFIGGMEGIHDEYNLVRDLASNAKIIVVPSPGGVARELFASRLDFPEELQSAIDFSNWFYKLLEISPSSPRLPRLG